MGCWGVLSKEGTYELRPNDLRKPVGGGEGRPGRTQRSQCEQERG